MIHSMAIVEEGAQIGEDVTVEPFAVVKSGVVLRDRVTIKSHAYINGNTTVGEETVIYPGASIGVRPQDRKYNGEETYVLIGKRCHIRESVTINSSCGEGETVSIGDDCLIMAYCHVAHNCKLGNQVTMSNNVIMAGHVEIEDNVTIGGMTPIHQRVRIGTYSMVGGQSRVTHDIPPYTLGGGIPYRFGGLNMVGLKRNQFDFETRRHLTHCFRLTYRSGLHFEEALSRIESEVEQLPEVKHWLDFCRASKRGLIGLQGVAQNAGDNADDLLEFYAAIQSG